MARITVEDCVDKIANRFELVLPAAHRARTIAKGPAATVEPTFAGNEVTDPPNQIRREINLR